MCNAGRDGFNGAVDAKENIVAVACNATVAEVIGEGGMVNGVPWAC